MTMNSKITIIAGNQGDQVTATVTVKASLKYDSTKVVYSQDRWELYNEGGSDYSYDSELQEARTLTFKVSMSDDDSKEESTENNDLSSSNYQFSSLRNENSPNLTDFSEEYSSSGIQNYKSLNDIIVITGQSSTIRGLSGDDVYIVSGLIPANFKGDIVDNSGNNIIEIPDNTLISKIEFTETALRITIDLNKVITINGADKFTYKLSANSLNSDSGVTFTYSGLAELFGVNQPITSLRTLTGEYYTKLSSSENNASSSQSSSGYTLKEIIDSSKTVLSSFNLSSGDGTLNSTSYDDMVILTGGMTHRGLDGDDLYFVSNLISENSSSSIVDTSGNNIIQIPDNTYIDSIIFSNDLRLYRTFNSTK